VVGTTVAKTEVVSPAVFPLHAVKNSMAASITGMAGRKRLGMILSW
jgi:hypothetical protein